MRVWLGAFRQAVHKSPYWLKFNVRRRWTTRRCERFFLKSVRIFQNIPGLQRKYFIHTDSTFDGVYLWDQRRSADAFFTTAWQKRGRKTYGAAAKISWFEVPVTMEGAAPAAATTSSVVAGVRIPIPWYAPHRYVVSRMRDSVAQYRAAPGLVFKYFTISDDDQFGGIYLWRDQAAADSFYDEAWRAGVLHTYKALSRIDVFAAPLVLKTAAATVQGVRQFVSCRFSGRRSGTKLPKKS